MDDMAEAARHARAAEPALADAVQASVEALRGATETLLALASAQDRSAGAVPFLGAFARVLGGHYHLKAALADPARRPLAAFFIERLLPEHDSMLAHGVCGAGGLPDADAQGLGR
jgi:hypothetical protein